MGDLELPKELLAVLPTDPYEQLDIARKITSRAISVRVSKLEAETGKLRQKLGEKESTIYNLQQNVAELEQSLQDNTDRLSRALDEQDKLTNERNALSANVKKLNRDVAKLETFKRTLMQSLQEEDEVSSQKDDSEKATRILSFGSSVGSFNLKQSDADSSGRISSLQSAAELVTASTLQDDEAQFHAEVKPGSQKLASLTPSQLTPQLTPTGSPKRQSAAGSPLQQSASGSPRWHSTSDARLSLPSSQPTSQHTTAPNSPPQTGSLPARTPRIDGKEFFRQARTRLSYEQFSAFLSIIKELNAHRQTKEDTLKRADEIFGSDNKDLYTAFDGLLSRHLPT